MKVHKLYIHIYIYIERERERVRVRYIEYMSGCSNIDYMSRGWCIDNISSGRYIEYMS